MKDYSMNNKYGIRLLVAFMLSSMFLFMSLSFADTPFMYNIISETKANSIVDTKYTKKLVFKLFENQDDILYNGKQVKITNNSFSIDVSKLSGKQSIVFTNSNGETCKFNFYFSDKKGNVKDYELVSGKDLNVFVTTYKGIKIVYTEKEKSSISKLKSYIGKMPKNTLINIKEVFMIPYSNTSNIAGSTKSNVITLYNYSKYDVVTQKNIIYHEIAHTWANSLIDKKVIDNSYTEYSEVVNKDGNYVSSYAKDFAHGNNGKLSEDFADSVAFYIINQKNFKKSYPNRTEYIKSLINS